MQIPCGSGNAKTAAITLILPAADIRWLRINELIRELPVTGVEEQVRQTWQLLDQFETETHNSLLLNSLTVLINNESTNDATYYLYKTIVLLE